MLKPPHQPQTSYFLTFLLWASYCIVVFVCFVCLRSQDVWTADFGDCYLVMNIRETSFIAMLAPANEDCDDPGIFLGPITVTSPASDSNADSSIIVSYVEVPESAEEQ